MISFNYAQAQDFCKVLASTLDAGMGYPQIILMLRDRRFSSKFCDAFHDELFVKSHTLSQAIEDLKILDDTSLVLIQGAEKTGKLPSVFDELESEYQHRRDLQRRIYWGFSGIFFFISLGFVVRAVVGPIFSDPGSLLNSSMTQLLRTVAIGCVQAFVFMLCTYLVYLFWAQLPCRSPLHRWVKSIFVTLPFVSQSWRMRSLANFCRGFAGAVVAGLPVHTIVEITLKSTQDYRYSQHLETVLRRIDQGESYATAFSVVDPLPPELIDMIALGESVGTLEENLLTQGSRYANQADELFEVTLNAIFITFRILIIIAMFVLGAVGAVIGLKKFSFGF